MALTTDSPFTKPEIEAAWLLIQLSGDSDNEDHLSSLQSDGHNRDDNDDLHVLIKDLGKKKGHAEEDREIQEQRQQSSGRSRSNYNYSDDASATSSAMSGTTVTKFLKRNRSGGEIDYEDEDDSEGVAYGMKRRNKKYRSVNEIYSQTKPLQIKLLA